jgi:NAD-dependent SIR2 family protein deacetylase
MGTLALIAAIALAGYVISLHLHPKGPRCRKCQGTGIQKGAIFTWTHRDCTRCGGRPATARAGVSLLHPDRQVWGERKPAEAAAERKFGR